MNRYSEVPIEISDSSSGNDEDDMDSISEEDSLNEIKKDLLRCLDNIQTAGRVAVSKQHEQFANPGLTIADTLIPLPLVPRDAETIKSVSREAPFGKGDETVVDASVRKTWELDHTQFTLANPAWQAYVASLLDDAAQSLAMSEVRAEPYKLLLYEEGSFFKRHKDSEKVPGMIGTMVICLPSKHDGGSVHLSHAGKSYVFETDKTSDFGLTSLSWFSDVTHEIKPLKSGYRLVLTYNIIHTGHKHMSAGLVGKQSERLRSVLVKWQSKLPFREKLVYMLDHQYTQSSLKLSNLKGRDRAICQSLYEVGLSCGFTIFLAKMTRTQSGDAYEFYEDEESTELEDVRACDGSIVCNNIYLEDEDILGSDLWDRDPDSEDEGEFTGNESMPSTLRYHDTVVVIVPMSTMPSFLPKPDPRIALSLASHTLEHRPDDRRLQASLLTNLENAILYGSPDGTLLSNVINLAIKLQKKSLYQVAVRTALKDSTSRQLVLETIVQLMKDDYLKDTQKQPDWDFWLGDAFYGPNKISLVILADVLNRLDALIQDDDLKVSFQSWRTPITGKMIKSKHILGMEDHDYLICLLFSQSNDLAWLTNWFAPILSSKGSNQLIYTILRDIYYNRQRKTLARATDAYRCILESSTEKLALRTRNFSAPQPYLSRPPSKNTLGFHKIIEVISLGLDMGLSKEVTKLLEMSCTNICQSSLELRENNSFASSPVKSFLEALLAVLQKHKVPPLECVKNMFVTLFRDIFVGGLPKRPTKSQGWKHRPINCHINCHDCRELNSFLVDSKEEEREFTMVTKQRQHLESQLPKNRFHCRTRTGRAPYGLIVTKLGKEFEEDMREYQRRLLLLSNELESFKCEYMRSLLGKELYQELVLLEDAWGADGAGTTRTAGGKRKAEEDLDGSSASRPRLIE
ncbi:hypothetical protein F4813DRAFT_347934 [Daldinia decipiens]|uniref:uncharacterized protein n=1 Tax=Daldinia decipiens TaxID=326647 RepID=UPI0020C3A676|nr:uncharacterized protein F4813DRAFT_347934 [Daldinia decipiens]KAI1661530.1 hypothetical protein F4813DRAFT_347934 [Daldinia decipiens]